MWDIQLVRQTTKTECGLACISMVSSYFGFQKPISYYRENFNIGRDGVSLKSMISILDSINLKSKAMQILDFEKYEFEDEVYIIHLKSSHYVVLKKKGKNRHFIWDPADGKRVISKSELQEISSGYCLLVSKKSVFKKEKSKINDFRHIIPVIRKSIYTILCVILTSAFASILSLAVPLLLKNIINDLVNDYVINYASIYKLIMVIIGLYFIISTMKNNLMVKLQGKLYNDISLKTICHLFRIKYSFYDNRTDGDILYRLSFLNQIQNAISSIFIQLLVSCTGVIVIIFYIVSNYSFLLPYLAIILLVSSALFLIFNKIILNMKKQELKSKEDVDSLMTEIVKSMYQIKCLHIDSIFLDSYKMKFKNFIQVFKCTDGKSKKLNLILNIIFTFTPFFILLYLIQESNKVSVGELFALYTILTTIFSQCLIFVSSISDVMILKASIFYINDLLDEEEILVNHKEVEIGSFENLKLKSMSFRYSDTSPLSLFNINMSVNKGKCIAIVGASGSGKTTLVKLIARLYQPSAGEIVINNTKLDDISKNDYLNIISMVTQSPVIFNKTIRNNIILDNMEISDEKVINALKVANIWEEVCAMPLGLDTFILSQGGNLSGGQIQRLAIARAIVHNPELLIMDEATSALDYINEEKIYKNLKEEKITQIIISHRLSTIMNADYIYVLSKGMIVEEGTHDKLLELNGIYSAMFHEKIS